MALSRRQFIGSGVTAALGASGLYGLLEAMVNGAGAATRPGPPPPPPPRGLGGPPPGRTPPQNIAPAVEQYLFSPRTITDNGVVVISPPLYHAVITAMCTGAPSAAAQSRLEAVLVELENEGLLNFTASGAGITFAWGQSYFAHLPSALTAQFLPIDLVASNAARSNVGALIPAIAFASDPSGVILEQNDLAVVIASDSLANVNACMNAIFDGEVADLFQVTSIRRGFVDASKLGGSSQSLTKQLAVAAGIPGASSIPNQAELFLGFTSTQRNALSPSNVSNLETLPGITNQFPNGYFVGGTTMHLSHITEDLPTWYAKSYPSRVGAAFSANRAVPATPQHNTLAAAAPENESQVRGELKSHGFVGHSSSMQPLSRLSVPTRDNYQVPWAPGTPIVSRADFNTLDNPFAFSSNPTRDKFSTTPVAGVHFVAYLPTSTTFQRIRQAMDGQYADGALGASTVHGPFNSVLQTTHRQNFLVPPKAHRSFPLAELA